MDQTASKGDAGRDALYKVAYDEAVRALSDQRIGMDSVRSRAGLLLSAASVTTSFLGARSFEAGALSPISWSALTSFISMALVSLAILLPPQGEFSADAREVIDAYIEAPEPALIGRLHRDLALHMHGSYVNNMEALDRLATLFQVACGLLIVEMIFWVLSIPL